MLDTWPLLEQTDFPPLKRQSINVLQVNLGYLCNQQCLHCHVDASPRRTEIMRLSTVEQVLKVLQQQHIKTLDLTGGAPEMNPHFRYLVEQSKQLGVHVIDRCNLTILSEPGYEDLAHFLAEQQVEVIASLPCYLEENVDGQRGKGVFQGSIAGLQKLNNVGFGKSNTGLQLNLVYNPIGAYLPPSQMNLEADYKKFLHEQFGLSFNHLFTITNMPIARFGSTLISKGTFHTYMDLLKKSYSAQNLKQVMCLSQVSIDWQGYVYDCDFNQMLRLNIRDKDGGVLTLEDFSSPDFQTMNIRVADHCYGCTAGQGSSCGGALE